MTILEERTKRHEQFIDSINGDLKLIQKQISELSFFVKNNTELKNNISKVAWASISAIVSAGIVLYLNL